MRKSAILVFLLLLPVSIRAQNPDLVLNPGSSYVDVGRSIPWSNFNRTYVIVPNSPNASLCVYVVNNNPSSSHSFSTSTFQSADSQVADYSNNTGRYNAVPLVNMPGTVPASGMVSGFTQSTAAAKVAIRFTGASGQAGSPDTADVFLVQTTSGTCGAASVSNQVQGTSAPGAAITGNPLLLGGTDPSGLARFLKLCPDSTATACSAANTYSLAIGAGGNQISGIPLTYPNASGALATAMLAGNSTGGAQLQLPMVSTGTANNSAQNPQSLFTSNGGYFVRNSNVAISGNIIQGFFFPGGGQGSFLACSVALQATNTGGTTPTLNVYFQTSWDGLAWTDRISFTQITTSASNQWAAVSGSGFATAPTVFTDGTLAAGSKVDGMLGAYARLKFVLGGTSPAYTVTDAVNCY